MFEALITIFLATAAPASTAVATPTAPPEKLVCRRDVVTGSMVTFKKRCMTKRDWARTTEASQKFGQDLQDQLRNNPNGS